MHHSNQGYQSRTNIFPYSSHPTINGALNSAGRDVNIYHNSTNTHERGIELLLGKTVTGAFYNAAERGDPPKCHPRTREAILKDIKQWIKTPRATRRLILWMNGPAGAGKSAIAQTIAEMCAEEGLLAASFFFFRTSSTRNNSSALIATIAYQLTVSIPRLRMYIGHAVERNSAIFDLTMRTQLNELILKPILEALSDGSTLHTDEVFPELVILDGLDECKKDGEQKEILDLLNAFATELKNIPLVFLVASRPEFTIRTKFNHPSMSVIAQGMVLDNSYRPDKDIKIFLQDTFNDIRDTHPDGPDLPQPWPLRQQLMYLVDKASGQFIYAATVARYVKSPRHDPAQRLNIILTLARAPASDTPFAQLDALYIHILSSIKDIPRVMDILTFIILRSFVPARVNSLSYLDQHFGYNRGESRRALIDMYALIEIPVVRSYETTPRIYHASLADFLMDRSRSGQFFIEPQIGHIMLAVQSFKRLNSDQNDMDTNHLLGHFIRQCDAIEHVPEELCQLMPFVNVPLIFSKCSTWYTVEKKGWDALFRYAAKWVSIEFSKTLACQLSVCILERPKIYPEPLRSLISTLVKMSFSIYVSSQDVLFVENNIYDLFTLLLHSLNLSKSEMRALRDLDEKEGFGLVHGDAQSESLKYIQHALKHTVTQSTEPTRDSSVHFIRQLVGFLSERQYYLHSLPDNLTTFDTDDKGAVIKTHIKYNSPVSVIHLHSCDFAFLEDVLRVSIADLDLAIFLQSCITQWMDEGCFLPKISRWNLIKYSLQYIERCRDILPDDFNHFSKELSGKYLDESVQWSIPQHDQYVHIWGIYEHTMTFNETGSESSSSNDNDSVASDHGVDGEEKSTPIHTDQEWLSIRDDVSEKDGLGENGVDNSTVRPLRRRVEEIYDDSNLEDMVEGMSNQAQRHKKARVASE